MRCGQSGFAHLQAEARPEGHLLLGSFPGHRGLRPAGAGLFPRGFQLLGILNGWSLITISSCLGLITHQFENHRDDTVPICDSNDYFGGNPGN